MSKHCEIPSGLSHLVKKDIKDMEVAGRYDRVEDVVRLNPELMDIPTLAEEFYHRKQDKILEKKGVTEQERDSQFFITTSEVGIIPTIRDIAKKRNDPTANNEFFRYAIEASKFSQHYLSLSDKERRRFKDIVFGERLFDGLSWVLEKIESLDYDPGCWDELAFTDSNGSKYWDEINKSRKKWRR